jgi:hypothetical membrane protein
MLFKRGLGTLILASVVYYVSVISAMHLLEPEFSPIRAPMSAYVLGAYGPLMTTTYFVLSAGLLGVAFGLVRTLGRTRVARIAFAVVLVAAAGVSLAGIFPMDFPPPVRTSSGRLHALGGGMAFPGMTVGLSLFSLSLRRDIYWRSVSTKLLALSAGMIAAFRLMAASIAVLGYGGYAQRLFILVLFSWMIVAGRHLLRSATTALPDGLPRG